MSPGAPLTVMRTALIILTVFASWFAMQAVHELGHVLAAVATAGTVDNVALSPLEFSRTDVSVNPSPGIVVWAGPVVGSVVPLVLWGLASLARIREAFLLRFFAGFCLVANGAYIGVGSLDGVGDCGEMLRLGTPIWALWIFGAALVAAGFLAWHGQARHFGFGPQGAAVVRRDVVVVAAAGAALLGFGVWVGH